MSSMQMSSMPAMRELQPGADGTKATADGLTLQPSSTGLIAGAARDWSFRILDRQGMAVTQFERDQTKLLHLIVVRDDLTHYQHLHPALSPDGTFTIPIGLTAPGRYRAIADFTTAYKRYALGTTLTVPGNATSVPLPGPSSTATTDGYTVRLAHGQITAGRSSGLTFAITREGRPLTNLQTYLGAYGHLVALRQGTLAYSHVHPDTANLRQGMIGFQADLRAASAYRLFLQFRANGAVHTAAFTLNAS